jgi:hypothetical protein
MYTRGLHYGKRIRHIVYYLEKDAATREQCAGGIDASTEQRFRSLLRNGVGGSVVAEVI